MRVNKISRGLVFTLTAVAALFVISVCPLLSVACASSHANRPPKPAVTSNVVIEWNDLAVRLTLQTVPALVAVQQTRVMAIFQLAVHDAVNGITGDFETYLSPPP